jgi:hypothetical protein
MTSSFFVMCFLLLCVISLLIDYPQFKHYSRITIVSYVVLLGISVTLLFVPRSSFSFLSPVTWLSHVVSPWVLRIIGL